MIALGGWIILQKLCTDASVDRFIGVIFSLGLLGMVAGIVMGVIDFFR